MCIIFLAYNVNKNYKLILAANRDEYYKRPTESAHFWKDEPNILGGRDLKELGTWMAINRNGKFGAVTNYRDFSLIKSNAVSRGHLVTNYLIENTSPNDYIKNIKSNKDYYNPFNLILGDIDSLYYYSNIENNIKKLEPGYYSVSNHLLNTPWPKVTKGSYLLKEIANKQNKINPNDLFEILSNKSIPDDDLLPDTGVGLKLERLLSPIYIESSDYGTRSSTVLLITTDNHVTFIERSLVDVESKKWNESKYEFII